MGQFTHDGVIYEEMPDGNVRVVGYASQAKPTSNQVVPPNPVLAARHASDEARKNASDRRDQIRTDLAVADRDKPSAGYRWADPQHTRQEIIPGGPADTSSGMPGLVSNGLAGEKFLEAMPVEERATVKALSDGRLAFPTGAGLRSPYWQRMLAAVAHYDPNFDAVNYNSRAATRKDFTSGVSARNITAFNTALGHLGTLYQAANDLHNRSFTPWNSVTNWAERGMGDPAVDKFNTARQAVTDELEKAFRGSNGTQAGIDEWKKSLNSSQSPAQMRAVIGQMADLLRSRINALGEQYKQGMGRSIDGVTLLDPHAQAVLQALVPDGTGTIGEPPRDNNPLYGGTGLFGNGPGGGNGNGGPPFPGPNGGTPLPQVVRSGPFSTEADIAFHKKLEQAYYGGASFDQLSQISQNEGRGSLSDEWRKAVDERNAGHPRGHGEPPKSGVAGMTEWLVGSPLGTAATTYFNSAAMGLPELVAGHDPFRAMHASNPWSAAAGDFAGSIAGSYGTGRLLRGVAGMTGSDKIARLLANPLTADTVYGSAYGANTSDDPVIGALTGGALAAGGNIIGSKAGKAIGSLRSPANPLNSGERAIMSAVDRTGRDSVVDALLKAGDLNIPATLADVSPEVESLTGAAIRRSPTVAGQARDTLIPRGRGQYDRFVSAIERDLGPVENIPQRSDDLIQQARASAAPLYDAAYGAPGASVFNVTDLMARPSMKRALGNAMRIAQEEGRDPATLGFVFDDAGNATLTRSPSWQTLDYVKRGLDDVLEGYRDKATGKLVLDTEGRAVNGTLQDFLKRMDQANPDYAAARAAYSTPAAERDALRTGQQAISMSPDQLSVNVGKATPPQLEQARLGFQSQLSENAGKLRYSTNPFESVLGTPAMEQRLSTLYPERGDSVSRLLAQGEMERQMAATSNRLVGNSMTAERQAADQAFQGSDWISPAVEVGANVLLGQVPIGTAIRGGMSQRAKDAVALGLGKRATAKAEQIAPIALNTNTKAIIDNLLSMEQRRMVNDAALERMVSQAQGYGRRAGTGVATALLASGSSY